MKSHKSYLSTMLLFLLLGASPLFSQVHFTVNSLADDQFSLPWDDPNTPEDEREDGICRDEQGRCTIRAAIEEANNMETPVNLTFSVNGTINLLDDGLYPGDGSTIDGGGNIELTGVFGFQIYDNCTIAGIKFNNEYNGIGVFGSKNVIGDGNTFININTALIIDGDSNLVGLNRFGIDDNNALHGNLIGIEILGNNNTVALNTICGNVSGILLSIGESNKIKRNFIGTTADGDTGLGNIEGILIAGSGYNLIGGETISDANVISGNDAIGIIITAAPPDDYSYNNGVWSNIIGLDYTQSYAIPNGNGIQITNGARYNDIGRNIIAGNLINGVHIFGYDADSWTYGHKISENQIGINSSGTLFPNGVHGISIEGNVQEVIIGANYSGVNTPNTIVGNVGSGISVQNQFGYAPSKITARKNLIYQNDGANLFISSASNDGILPPHSLSFSNNTIAGIHNIPNVLIDIYKANINEFQSSAYQWLGSTTAGANGVFSYHISDPTIEAVSLTANTSIGNTSGFGFLDLITDVEEEDDNIPTEFSLSQNYPNPFNPSTKIKFTIPILETHRDASLRTTLKIYDVLGNEVATLVDGYKPAGAYEVDFTANILSSGIYFYQLSTGNFIQTRKMTILK